MFSTLKYIVLSEIKLIILPAFQGLFIRNRVLLKLFALRSPCEDYIAKAGTTQGIVGIVALLLPPGTNPVSTAVLSCTSSHYNASLVR